MKKILFFNFDGTNNEPLDGKQNINSLGMIEDDNITNIVKFHLLLGGNFKSNPSNIGSNSLSFYYKGIGTYGSKLRKVYNSLLSKEGGDVSNILNRALEDFKKHYKEEEKENIIIVLTGFSRGAALARRFASLINDKVAKNSIIEAVYDTVASIGLPNLSKEDRPKSDVVFENGCTLPSNVKKALHLVSLDDKRKAFQPTLMNNDGRVEEIWFAGAHSDVGGGYRYDGLSDLCLRFFLDWFENQEYEIKFKSSKNIDYKNILGEELKDIINIDDVQINPNIFGKNHEQERGVISGLITLTHRKCCVIKDDKATDIEPTIYYSVAERIFANKDYKPKSLENLKHKILYSDFKRKSFKGISEHRQLYKRDYIIPTIQGVETFIFAHMKFNHTRIYFEKGKSYKIEVQNDYKWSDGSIKELDGLGWNRDDISFGLKEIPIYLSESLRRVPSADWFTLCGSIDMDEKTYFKIGNSTKYLAKNSGEFCAFANDLDGYYGNNTGKLKIKITLIQE